MHDLDPCHTLPVALLDAPPMDDDVHSAMDAARSAILADLLSSLAWRIAQRTISPRHGVDPTALCEHASGCADFITRVGPRFPM